ALQHETRNFGNDHLCHAGIARTTLHLGDIRRGRQLALDSDNLLLCRECAAILESMNQLQDAAELFERGGQYEKAASIYIQTKSFSLAQPLMAKISTPKLHVQYAKAKEAEGRCCGAPPNTALLAPWSGGAPRTLRSSPHGAAAPPRIPSEGAGTGEAGSSPSAPQCAILRFGCDALSAILRFGCDALSAILWFGCDALSAILRFGCDALNGILWFGWPAPWSSRAAQKRGFPEGPCWSELAAGWLWRKFCLLVMLGRAAGSRYEEAVQAYETAKDLDNVVRLTLQHLNNPQRAFALVRRVRSAEGALLVSKFCTQSGDYPAAIEFLLMARRGEEAFEMAQSHEEMDTYVRILGTAGTPEEYQKLAKYYESKGIFAKAGELYEKCEQYQQALKLYLRCGATEIDRAINVVGRANNDMLTNQLVDFLMGETDGIQKDHNYLFRLHMALHQYEQAAHTAVLIARQEQEMGNYKLSHTQLFDTFKELELQNKRPPAELTRQLMLLHSYILVKTLVKLNDHSSAARMLIRVAKNISKFPRHVVPILTSTVIECQRSGNKKTAFEYASMLMRPEYRQQISAQYKRKIENIVRKPDKADEEEPMSECPHCRTLGPESELECNNCKNIIPYCIATGRRMVLSDWAQCPSCRFPCRASVFVKIIASEKLCPMCNQPVVLSAIQKITDPVAMLKAHAESCKNADNQEDEQSEQTGA
ncbi:hypothetical protein CYMTET_50059, partial [Cymbomonas tetramitiformis]